MESTTEKNIEKKPCETPTLVEVGNVEEVTQGNQAAVQEGAGASA